MQCNGDSSQSNSDEIECILKVVSDLMAFEYTCSIRKKNLKPLIKSTRYSAASASTSYRVSDYGKSISYFRLSTVVVGDEILSSGRDGPRGNCSKILIF